jgi:hypothetical protein
MSRSLSPAAQAAWEAYNDVIERVGTFEGHGDAIAAAFYAAAHHLPNDRRVLAAIADELEGRSDG